MKRISWTATLLAATFTIGPFQAAQAVDTSRGARNSDSQNVTPQNNLYNPSTLPGQGYYGVGGGQNDPFFNPGIYNPTPAYPAAPTRPGTNPSPRVPNPNPTTYPNGPAGERSRISSPQQPKYVAPGTTTPTPQQRKWRLGVYSKDTETGVRIHDVVSGSAAKRAGLEINDTIISVNGYQVGYVNGQLFDCGTEFDRLADENGWVTLLVQNNRDNKLINVPVQLDSRLSTLTGSIALQNRQNLPSNAVVNVELKEVVGNNSNPVTFASTQIDKINQYPIPFKLDFDPAHIASNGRYLVYASVLVNGRETFRTAQTQPVLTQAGQIRPVTLQLERIQQNNSPYPNTPPVHLEQDAQIAQIVKWFNDYLGRNPSDRELVTWLEALRQGQSIAQVQLSLLANDQFFNRCDADKRVYIERLHEMLIGRKPSIEEMNYWVARYDAQGGIRRDVAREFQGALGIH